MTNQMLRKLMVDSLNIFLQETGHRIKLAWNTNETNGLHWTSRMVGTSNIE